MVSHYYELTSRYNELVARYYELVSRYYELVSRYNELVSRYFEDIFFLFFLNVLIGFRITDIAARYKIYSCGCAAMTCIPIYSYQILADNSYWDKYGLIVPYVHELHLTPISTGFLELIYNCFFFCPSIFFLHAVRSLK